MEKCKFFDCRHETESGCAVKAAIKNGELTLERWQSYLKMKHEANFAVEKIFFCLIRMQEIRKKLYKIGRKIQRKEI